MTWLQWYRIRSYIKYSIWIPPVIGIAAAMLSVRVIFDVDASIGLTTTLDPGATRDLLISMAASMFTLIVFVSSTLLLAVQLASAQLTPRVISLFFRNPTTKVALTVFVFTFTFALAVEIRIKETIPIIAVRTAAYSCLFSLALFIFMIDHVGRFLRPTGMLQVVFRLGRDVIRNVYPKTLGATANGEAPETEAIDGESTLSILSMHGGVILALDVEGLVRLAERCDCIIEMAPQVGDFIAAEEPLFRIYGGQAVMEPGELLNLVAIGSERTMEQDPTFAFRIIVDIASKGLSPAINDPTTAVLAIDHIHRLLRMVGLRKLDDDHVRDARGRLRFVYRTPDWEDFVQLAVTEIRQFGATSIQVTRRLRAMLENLIQTLPDSRKPILRQELSRLQRSAERSFAESDDRALAEISDAQGVGGNSD